MKLTVGSYLVISITGCLPSYIAEITQEEPLRMKVQETGPYAGLREGDYIIHETMSKMIQDPKQQDVLVRERVDRGQPLISGLASLGITDDELHEIIV